MSSWTPTRAKGPPSCPSGRRGGVRTSVDGSAGPRRIRLLHQRVLRGVAVSLASADRSQGLWRRPAGCRGGLRTNAAAQRLDDESREGPTAFAGVMSRPSGRGAAPSSAGGLSRRRGAVSRRLAPVLLGAPRRAGSPRSSSSELGRRPEVVKRFHGGADVIPCRGVDELFGALRPLGSSRSSSSEPDVSQGRHSPPGRSQAGRIPSRRLFGARGSLDGWPRSSKRASTRFVSRHPALRGEVIGDRSADELAAPNAGRGGWLNTLEAD